MINKEVGSRESGVRRWESGFSRLIRSGHPGRNLRILVSAMKHLKQHITSEFWNLDHFMWYTGMWNENFVRISKKLRSYGGASYAATLIEDFVVN